MLAVQLRQIQKSYFGKTVLEDISLELEQGHFYALIGQNGAGKSTLMRILDHTEAPDKGDGTIMGFELSEDAEDFNRVVGYASESVTLPNWGSVGDFLARIRELYPNWDQSRFDGAAKAFGVDLSLPFTALSRGQRMQVCLSYTFAIRAKLLLLDEVTAALDARVRAIAVKLCKEFVEEGGTAILATNIVSEVSPAADRMIYLEKKKIRLVAGVDEISRGFIKLRKASGVQHPIFSSAECVELRVGDDNSLLYLVPASAALGLSSELLYPGKATAEDVFVYFMHTAQREKQ
jgi:ABC-2 type transport system ATP-binding protein